MPDIPEFLTVEEAAVLLRIGRTSAYALAKQWRDTGGQKGLPVIELGRQLRVPRAALMELHAAAMAASRDELPSRLPEPDIRDWERHRRRLWGS
jgi:excisionase family DNA binding protein